MHAAKSQMKKLKQEAKEATNDSGFKFVTSYYGYDSSCAHRPPSLPREFLVNK